jgi:hypothetical protein
MLGGMRSVIDADTHDLFRIGNDRQEAQARELLIRLDTLGGAAQLVQRAGRDHVAQGRVAATEAIIHGGDAIADDHAEGRLAVGDIACEFHGHILNKRNSGGKK